MLAKYPDVELINVDKMGIGANPANLHEIENDKEKLNRRKDDEGRNDQPFRKGQIDEHDLNAGDDREDHRDLDEGVEFAVRVAGIGGRRVSVGVHGGWFRGIRGGIQR